MHSGCTRPHLYPHVGQFVHTSQGDTEVELDVAQIVFLFAVYKKLPAGILNRNGNNQALNLLKYCCKIKLQNFRYLYYDFFLNKFKILNKIMMNLLLKILMSKIENFWVFLH